MKKVLGYLVILSVPLVLVLTSLRLLLTHQFVTIEYQLPSFPDDRFGMTQEQRLKYAPLALDYLFNDQGIDFLSAQTFPDGTPLYSQRGLDHMAAAKALIHQLSTVYLVALVLLFAVAAAAWFLRVWPDFLEWLSVGGKLTVILDLLILALFMIDMNAVFTGFHTVFFKEDPWFFLDAETPNRLFPFRFYRDISLTATAFSLGSGALLRLWFRSPLETGYRSKQMETLP